MKRTGWFLVVLSVGWMAFQSLEAQAQGLPLLNDDFSDATVLVGFPVSTIANNVNATMETGEPYPSGAAASVWFAWEAPFNGSVRIETERVDSDFHPVLAAWAGSSLETLDLLELVYSYDRSQIGFFMDVTLGTTYHIAVYGEFGTTGEVTLQISPDPTSSISGRVVGPDGMTPLQGISAAAYSLDGSEWVEESYAETDSNGEYTLMRLFAGTYRVDFNDWSEDLYIPEAYDDAPDLDSGTDLILEASSALEGINAILSSSGPPAAPVIVELKRVGSSEEWEIRFVGVVDETYVLQETESMSHSFTDVVGSERVCQPATNSFFRQSGAPACFWRVRMVP